MRWFVKCDVRMCANNEHNILAPWNVCACRFALLLPNWIPNHTLNFWPHYQQQFTYIHSAHTYMNNFENEIMLHDASRRNIFFALTHTHALTGLHFMLRRGATMCYCCTSVVIHKNLFLTVDIYFTVLKYKDTCKIPLQTERNVMNSQIRTHTNTHWRRQIFRKTLDDVGISALCTCERRSKRVIRSNVVSSCVRMH